MYVCGPTVYYYIHIGNGRTFVTFDVLRRYLEYKGYKVKYVSNITDVGHLTEAAQDKIMSQALKEKVHPMEIIERYLQAYLDDLRRLNVKLPNIMPRATGHIPDIIEAVQKLIEKGYAYAANGEIFFDISKFKEYGKLSKISKAELASLRLEPNPAKRNAGDFALWKAAPSDYPLAWPSPWGRGFPGWHIECSIMSSKYLGLPLDIHGGGEDLIFPHHENEIAQSEALYGKKFVNYWMHVKHLTVRGSKMSKSKGNYITVSAAIERYGVNALRMFYVMHHYREACDFSEAVIEQARANFDRIWNALENLRRTERFGKEKIDVVKFRSAFESAMEDDLNTPAALNAILAFVKELNKKAGKLSKQCVKGAISLLEDVFEIFGFVQPTAKVHFAKLIDLLVEVRSALRAQKQFGLADQIRAKLAELGIVLEDKNGETVWRLG